MILKEGSLLSAGLLGSWDLRHSSREKERQILPGFLSCFWRTESHGLSLEHCPQVHLLRSLKIISLKMVSSANLYPRAVSVCKFTYWVSPSQPLPHALFSLLISLTSHAFSFLSKHILSHSLLLIHWLLKPSPRMFRTLEYVTHSDVKKSSSKEDLQGPQHSPESREQLGL